MFRLVVCLLAFAFSPLAGPLFAQDADLAERVRRLEESLAEERARSQAREKRIDELEESLTKATDTLAQSMDRSAS